ncbi:MAG: hypothetical protein QM692_16405 [Thermomicrobiales bacterium]
MDHSPFTASSRASASRRAIAAAIAAVPLAALLRLPAADDAAAKKRRARPEHNVRGKNAVMCINGVTKRVPRAKRRKYVKRGATRGACPTCDCASGFLCCNNACVTAVWANQTTFGSGPGAGPSQFAGPARVAISRDTLTAWIADTVNQRIAVWTRPTSASTAWTSQTTFGSGPGAGPNQFRAPAGLAASADALTLWITDSNNDRISIWTRPTASSTAWSNQTTFGVNGSGVGQLTLPNDVALSPDTLTAWVADTGNNRISVWTRPSATSTAWNNPTAFGSGPGAGPSQFDQPLGVAVSADTLTVWVAEGRNNRISVWTRPSAASTTWSNQTTFGSGPGAGPANFDAPASVAIAADALTAWIADSANDRISVWSRPTASSAAWSPLTTFGTSGSGPANFANPTGIALSPDDSVAWIADYSNDRISVWAAACPA